MPIVNKLLMPTRGFDLRHTFSLAPGDASSSITLRSVKIARKRPV